ncbi:hypothetical protein, partial [Pseudorhodobacter sp.]|uniref:hypothetical protein n=1 Tax=Pseudorhodobacter sp. TaxID=1934400 RepID=UPI002646FE41
GQPQRQGISWRFCRASSKPLVPCLIFPPRGSAVIAPGYLGRHLTPLITMSPILGDQVCVGLEG